MRIGAARPREKAYKFAGRRRCFGGRDRFGRGGLPDNLLKAPVGLHAGIIGHRAWLTNILH
jgi:hypothetical protein